MITICAGRFFLPGELRISSMSTAREDDETGEERLPVLYISIISHKHSYSWGYSGAQLMQDSNKIHIMLNQF